MVINKYKSIFHIKKSIFTNYTLNIKHPGSNHGGITHWVVKSSSIRREHLKN